MPKVTKCFYLGSKWTALKQTVVSTCYRCITATQSRRCDRRQWVAASRSSALGSLQAAEFESSELPTGALLW